MKVDKINNNNKTLVINLLKNINGLSIDNHILNNCHVLIDDNDDIVGTISFEKFSNMVVIRYFVFKRNITNNDLYELYLSLEKELINKNIDYSIAIINNESVEEVFKYLGFSKIDKNKVYFDETKFLKTNYKNNEIYLKKCNNNYLY